MRAEQTRRFRGPTMLVGLRRVSLGILAATALTATRPSAQARALAIHEIQGPGARSPVDGQLVTTTGIVTARKSNGVFIQTPDSAVDGDPRTSQALFVFTSTAPAATLTPGTLVAVTGRVLEFVPGADPASPPLTELAESPVFDIRGAGATLPDPIEITAAMASPSGGHDALEHLEGMRVRVSAMTLVSGTLGSFTEATGAATSNGVFYGVVTGHARPFREAGVDARVPLPAGAPCCVPRFDGNPERIRVDSDGQPGAAALNLAAGTLLRNLVGPLDYGFQSYTILPDPASPPVIAGVPEIPALRPPVGDEFTIASLNVQRLFDTVDDPLTSDVVVMAGAYQARLAKLSSYIRRVLHMPDLVAVQEVENLGTLQAIAATINRDAREAGETDPRYEAYLEEGNDPSGIDVGVLARRARVDVLDYRQFGRSTPFISPTTGRVELLNDRPSLVLVARVHGPFNARSTATLIVNHLRSLTDIDAAGDGPRVRAKRALQAEYVADLVQARLDADPNERIVVLGDLNAFDVNDGYVDVVGTIRGSPAPRETTVVPGRDRVEPDLIALIDTLPRAERYSYVFDGTAQTLDHLLVTGNLVPYLVGVRYARGNADAPEVWRADPRRPERVSDHDAALLYLSFFPPR